MNTINAILEKPAALLHRKSVVGDTPEIFTDIYEEDVNIAILERELDDNINASIDALIDKNPLSAAVLAVTPENAVQVLQDHFRDSSENPLFEDIAIVVDMFCCLFDLKRAGLRLSVLDRAMCPRFHIDRIPCRLVTTYKGIATQWLNNNVIDRTKLGTGSQGKSDEESGLIKQLSDINQLSAGDIALLKGEHWQEAAGGGLVHRSPAVSKGENRLLLTLDFIDD